MESDDRHHRDGGTPVGSSDQVLEYIEDMASQLAQLALAHGDFRLASALQAVVDAARRPLA